MGWVSLRRKQGLQWLGLAALALVLRLMVPAGFMVAPSQGFSLVICTGHGALADAPRDKAPATPEKSSDHVCPFAGGLALESPPGLDLPGDVLSWPVHVPRVGLGHMAPGRGLAAPPPPSHAPPRLFLI